MPTVLYIKKYTCMDGSRVIDMTLMGEAAEMRFRDWATFLGCNSDCMFLNGRYYVAAISEKGVK